MKSAFASLSRAMRSRRTAAVSLLSFSSGLPLGLVWFAIPDWMRDIGVDIRVVGLFSLAQAPWAFKVVWSPLMDRFVPPFWGRRRGWMALTQIALAALGLLLAGVGRRPEAIWVVGAIGLATGLASASQDIAYDAYTVEVLHPDEQGVAVGARVAMYRAAMAVSGGLGITLAARVGWPLVNVMLAALYIPVLLVTWTSPEPETPPVAPKSLRDAVWLPLVDVLSRPRALEILSFVMLYKLADQLSQALTRPFLIDMGYDATQRGIALATIGLVGTVAGAVIGGWVTTLAGLGHSLWVFGLLQIFSNAGYWLLAQLAAPRVPVMYAATGFELLTSGMGTGAFSVLLLRLTERRFSATQYALFSSLFALPRILAGPIAGFAVNAMGWSAFYLATMVTGIPGLVMLARFVPIGVRDPQFVSLQPTSATVTDGAFAHAGQTIDATLAESPALTVHVTADLALKGVAAAIVAAVAGSFVIALMAALDAARQSTTTSPGRPGLGAAWLAQWQPAGVDGWLNLGAIVTFAVIVGLGVVAASSVRRQSSRKR